MMSTTQGMKVTPSSSGTFAKQMRKLWLKKQLGSTEEGKPTSQLEQSTAKEILSKDEMLEPDTTQSRCSGIWKPDYDRPVSSKKSYLNTLRMKGSDSSSSRKVCVPDLDDENANDGYADPFKDSTSHLNFKEQICQSKNSDESTGRDNELQMSDNEENSIDLFKVFENHDVSVQANPSKSCSSLVESAELINFDDDSDSGSFSFDSTSDLEKILLAIDEEDDNPDPCHAIHLQSHRFSGEEDEIFEESQSLLKRFEAEGASCSIFDEDAEEEVSQTVWENDSVPCFSQCLREMSAVRNTSQNLSSIDNDAEFGEHSNSEFDGNESQTMWERDSDNEIRIEAWNDLPSPKQDYSEFDSDATDKESRQNMHSLYDKRVEHIGDSAVVIPILELTCKTDNVDQTKVTSDETREIISSLEEEQVLETSQSHLQIDETEKTDIVRCRKTEDGRVVWKQGAREHLNDVKENRNALTWETEIESGSNRVDSYSETLDFSPEVSQTIWEPDDQSSLEYLEGEGKKQAEDMKEINRNIDHENAEAIENSELDYHPRVSQSSEEENPEMLDIDTSDAQLEDSETLFDVIQSQLNEEQKNESGFLLKEKTYEEESISRNGEQNEEEIEFYGEDLDNDVSDDENDKQDEFVSQDQDETEGENDDCADTTKEFNTPDSNRIMSVAESICSGKFDEIVSIIGHEMVSLIVEAVSDYIQEQLESMERVFLEIISIKEEESQVLEEFLQTLWNVQRSTINQIITEEEEDLTTPPSPDASDEDSDEDIDVENDRDPQDVGHPGNVEDENNEYIPFDLDDILIEGDEAEEEDSPEDLDGLRNLPDNESNSLEPMSDPSLSQDSGFDESFNSEEI